MALRLLCTPEIYLYRAEIQYFLIGSRIFLPFFSLPKNLVVLNIHECLKIKFTKHSEEQNSF